MTKIGQRLAKREATLKPAELYCKNFYQESYKCNHCHPDGNDLVVNSKVPQAICHTAISQVASWRRLAN